MIIDSSSFMIDHSIVYEEVFFTQQQTSYHPTAEHYCAAYGNSGRRRSDLLVHCLLLLSQPDVSAFWCSTISKAVYGEVYCHVRTDSDVVSKAATVYSPRHEGDPMTADGSIVLCYCRPHD